MKNKTMYLFMAVLLLTLSACSGLENGQNEDVIKASGTISATDISVSSEISGKVSEIMVKEGDMVAKEDLLFTIEDDALQLQYNQAQAAVEVAQTSVSAAQTQLDSVQVQYDMALRGSRLAETETRLNQWQNAEPTQINLPNWYFNKEEKLSALETEVQMAKEQLELQTSNLQNELEDINNDDFLAVEKELSEAQTAFKNAQFTLSLAQAGTGENTLRDIAQEEYDTALAELESVQLEYERILNTTAAENLLQARAQLAYAQARYDNALDALTAGQSGEDALEVKAAQAAVNQAQAAINQAEANLKQAQAAVALLNLQLEKSQVKSPADGIILSRNLENGEFTSPGGTAFVIGKLSTVYLTVYIPEDQYGKVKLGQSVNIQVDSFPNQTFTGEVTYIADEAEFTPRNVQTFEGRKTTVFAVKITIENQNLDLKPGMPADVEIETR